MQRRGIKKPSDVENLAFQGGGGKGFAYIGAVQALEKLGILPAVGRPPVSNVRGIAGASAGSITAFLLAMKCNSNDFQKLFGSSLDLDAVLSGSAYDFDSFFDGPDNGLARGVSSDDFFKVHRVPVVERNALTESSLDYLLYLRNVLNLSGQARGVSVLTPMALLATFLGFVDDYLDDSADQIIKNFPFMEAVLKQPKDYSLNLLYDRGIFPGFGVRQFLQYAARTFIPRLPNWHGGLPDPARITFSDFRELTKIDLVVAGTNLSQRRSQLFSAANTPNFPVVEAVGISSCFPVAWKPVWVFESMTDASGRSLEGYWIDGGFLNNLPLKAFGSQGKIGPNTLAFQLKSGAPQSLPTAIPSDRPGAALANFALDLYETAFSITGQGNLLTEEEISQTIEIFSYSLSLFELSPSLYSSNTPVAEAKRQVEEYFS